MKLLITFAFAANLVAPAAGTGLRSLWSSSLGEQQDGRDLQGTFFECGNVTRSFCHTASQDCVDDACVCKPGMVSDGRVCVDLDECATDFPCAGTDLVDVFCEDRDPDNFFYKCNCMPGFATVLPVPDGEITIGTVTIPSIGGVPISFRPLSCVFIPVPEPAPTPAPVETIQLINGTNVTVTPAPTNPPTMPGPQCTRKCNEGKESCLDDGNPNADGLFKCTCVGGFTRAPNGDACIPGDGCVDNICGVGALCVQLSEDSGGHTCVCPTGTVGGAFTACVDPALLSSNITIRYPLIFQQEVNVTQVIAILNAAMNSLVNETVAGSGGEVVAGVESAGVQPIENLAAGGAIVVEAIRVICPLGSAAGAFCLNITQVIPVQSADATPAMGIQAELEGRIEVLIDNDRFDDILRNQTFVGVNGNPVTVIVIEPEDLPTAAPNVRNLRNFEMDDEDYYDHVDKTCDCVFCDEDEQCGQLWFGDEVAKPQQFTKMHIVISHCEHDLGWLEEKKLNDMNLEVDVTVISKCGKPVLGAPHGSKIITLPNTGRNDHTYAYYIVNELKATEGNDAVVIFTKDNIGANNIHQVGNWRSFQKMVQVAWNRGFACGIESSNLPVGDTEYSVSTYHDMKYLGEFSLEKYTRNSGAVNSDFQSSSYQDINDFIHQTLAPAQLPERVMPVCYGGLFAASTKNIFAQPEEVWISVERSLTRGNNILEGHFVERLWAGLLSTPLTASQTAALVAYSDHVYHAGDSIDGALIHEPTIYEAVSIEANSLDTIHGSIVENNKQVDNDKPKLYLLVGPTKQGCELAKSNEALMKDNLYYVGTNLEECLGHDIERPTLSKQAAADLMDGCFTAFGKNSKNCGNHWDEFKNTLEYYSVRDHNVIVALEALGGVEFMTESHRARMLELEELWNVVPVVTYQHFHEFVPAMFSVQQDSWNKKDQTTTIADSFSQDFGYQVTTAMPNINKLNPLSVYVTFTGLFEKTLPVMDLNSAIDSNTAFACDILKSKSTCQSLSASSSTIVDDNLVIADALAVAAHEQGLVHKESSRRAVRQEIFTLLTEERELDVPEKCMSPVQLKELYRVSAKMNQAMPGVESIINTDQDHKVCSVDAVQMLKDNAAAFHGVFMAHATAATVAQE